MILFSRSGQGHVAQGIYYALVHYNAPAYSWADLSPRRGAGEQDTVSCAKRKDLPKACRLGNPYLLWFCAAFKAAAQVCTILYAELFLSMGPAWIVTFSISRGFIL